MPRFVAHRTDAAPGLPVAASGAGAASGFNQVVIKAEIAQRRKLTLDTLQYPCLRSFQEGSSFRVQLLQLFECGTDIRHSYTVSGTEAPGNSYL